MPLVQSSEFRSVRIVFDGEFRRVKKDEERFRIFFLNLFGRRYPTVRWHNVTASEGSVVVDAVITGVSEELERTAENLARDIGSGRADIRYEDNRPWKASSVFMPSRRLLEEEDGAEAKEEAGLSVAWIVAIVINVVLIVVFVIAIVYCYCRRKKQRELARTAVRGRFQGGPEPLLFATKAAAEGKAPFQTVFTVEDGRRTCNCYSPRCYCSVGDGRRTEATDRRYVEENEDDPQGYPSPSPEPTFPTPPPPTPPQPPSPDPSDFWRAETRQEEDPDDMFLPGAISDPEPEPVRDVRYLVYRVDDGAGSRELLGQVSLPEDSFLSEARRAIDRDLRVVEDYRFLDQNFDTVLHYQESSLDLDRIYPDQEIHIRLPEKPKPKTPSPGELLFTPHFTIPLL
ncbi:uncharacterized protein LOC129233047 [Uloborus diversus]|uniref:uncharacterized protein LOC129233047 n=1 Tax=Uloborus diversus TaxID=327109 RepID=UPI0024093262|nr:uncharacterized protein LOC129233047 [Uloborus diversus]